MPTTTAPARCVLGAPHRTDASLIGQLNLEWARLRLSPTSSQTLRHWAAHESALTGFTSLPQIEAAATNHPCDGLLLALLRRNTAGDELAGRVVLQLMLAKAVRIAVSQQVNGDREEAEAIAVAALWESIRRYPLSRRPRSIAGNLALDTLNHVRSARRNIERLRIDPCFYVPAVTRHDPPPELEVRRLLTWGVRFNVITPKEATLIHRVYSVDHTCSPTSSRDLAQELGITWPALRQRTSRAVRRLAAAAAHTLV